MNDLIREHVDCVCELIPGFFLGGSNDIIYGTPDVWSAFVLPKTVLSEKVKSMGKNWKLEIEKNPGYPKFYSCTVSRKIHNYEN